MKLLIYSHYFAPSIGGVESIVLSLASGLCAQQRNGFPDFEVILATETAAGSFQDGSLPFRIIRQPSGTQLRRLIQEADVVHVAGPAFQPIVYGILFRKPVVVEHHGFQVICPTGQLLQEPEKIPCEGHFMAGHHLVCLNCISQRSKIVSFRSWILTFFRRELCKHVAANITPTAWLGHLLQLPRSETVPHGLTISPSLIHPSTVPDVPLLVFVGRLVSTKGVHLLLEASAILRKQNRPFELCIVGDGPERTSLEDDVRRLQLNPQVRFEGRVTPLKMAEILKSAAMVVVPSLGGEVFGMVVAENMLRGIPVVSSDLGAFVEVLGDAGLTFRTGDPRDLSDQITHLLNDGALSDRIRKSARQRVLGLFTIDRMVKGHAEIYQRLASEKVHRGT